MPRYPGYLHLIIATLFSMLYFIPVVSAGTNPAWKFTTRWGTVIFIVLTLVPYFIKLLGIDRIAKNRRAYESDRNPSEDDETVGEEEVEISDVDREQFGSAEVEKEYMEDKEDNGVVGRNSNDPIPGETTSKVLGLIVLINQKLFKRFHWIFASIAFILTIAHGLQVGRCHILNQLSMVVFGFFMGTGIAIKFKLVPIENMKRVYILHTHHFMVVLFLGIIAIVHIFYE